MRIRGTALGLVALVVVGCAPEREERPSSTAAGAQGAAVPQPGSEGMVETAPNVLLGRPGGAVAAGTQDGLYPLGPSTGQVGPRMRTGQEGVSLDGTVPSRLVRSVGQQQGQPQGQPQGQGLTAGGPRPRMGGDVAYIPGAPDRYGGGMTARNGEGGRERGEAYVPGSDFTDPDTFIAQGGPGAQGAGAQQGVGGAGTSGGGATAGGGTATGGAQQGGAQQQGAQPQQQGAQPQRGGGRQR